MEAKEKRNKNFYFYCEKCLFVGCVILLPFLPVILIDYYYLHWGIFERVGRASAGVGLGVGCGLLFLFIKELTEKIAARCKEKTKVENEQEKEEK